MKIAAVSFALVAVAACTGSEEPEAASPDAGITQPDAPPPEPKPAFTASTMIGGKLAIDDAGIRATYKRGATEYKSRVTISLTDTATNKMCSVTLLPKLDSFGHASTSTRQFKTVNLDFAGSTMMEDGCKWDDAWILSQLDQQFGHYIVGFAKARFAEDQPYLDVYYDAVQPFPNSTANIVSAGSGTAYGMTAEGVVGLMMVEPAPGTLVPALYEF
ncbi:MAG TPA: hypothetical protein VMZ53_25430 [Kofleriaceae bacterium]|nr:hypothetical protein [Kofleriaceae bacterium]